MKYLVMVFLLFFTACKEDVKAPRMIENSKNKAFLSKEKQFQAVWDEVKSDSLNTLPQNEVSYLKLGSVIFDDAKRTINNHQDILKPFDKLAHPNGICLKGLWNIEEENPYSGYFKKGSEALVIARASSALNNTKKGENRAFGLGIKLFPTTDPLAINTENSANFFVIDDLGGTDAPYFTDVKLTNEPEVSGTFEVVKFVLYLH